MLASGMALGFAPAEQKLEQIRADPCEARQRPYLVRIRDRGGHVDFLSALLWKFTTTDVAIKAIASGLGADCNLRRMSGAENKTGCVTPKNVWLHLRVARWISLIAVPAAGSSVSFFGSSSPL
jgi:hypothetical protein